MDRVRVIEELETQGYSVIPNVLSDKECEKYISIYKAWVHRFGDERPYWDKSLMQQYRLSHCEPTWNVRLAAKHVFASIWKTDKLLTSMDGIAIGEPPELGKTNVGDPESYWFHMDQGSWREGLHVYQGAVYLEETTETDYCFRVLENSVQFHKKFYENFPKAVEEAAGEDFFCLSKEHFDWYLSKGCKIKKVPVLKGGIVLWDSRTIHDNKAPLVGRPNSDRWRFVVFVCMAPAIWATEQDIEMKKKAYNEMVATAHWPSQGVWIFPKTSEREATKKFAHLEIIEELPEVAQTEEVLQMVGIEKYNFDDGQPTDPGWNSQWSVDPSTKKVKSSEYFA
ncbi:unnamed protein product [Mytilus coruscus]|uniref:Phytanoyl-CoA dioxygenase n=1 Tax=Mytilus coruscus TaxID=42192 RepID=A0A6J8EYZ3_MYTCO|nr:unnamed protein product [Mytilus coruscus]